MALVWTLADLNSLRHDDMYVLQVFLTREYLAISMEFAQGGDLFAYTLGPKSYGKLAEAQARWIFQQLILGLDYCHRKVCLGCSLCHVVQWHRQTTNHDVKYVTASP